MKGKLSGVPVAIVRGHDYHVDWIDADGHGGTYWAYASDVDLATMLKEGLRKRFDLWSPVRQCPRDMLIASLCIFFYLFTWFGWAAWMPLRRRCSGRAWRGAPPLRA